MSNDHDAATPRAAAKTTAGRGETPRVGRAAAAKAKTVIDKTADRLSDGVKATSAKSQVVAERASDGFQKLAERVDPFVVNRPYATLGAGIAAGLLIGFILGRPKVIYVKPRA